MVGCKKHSAKNPLYHQVKRVFSLCFSYRGILGNWLAVVVKWQTRRLEVPVGETPWRFKSSRLHYADLVQLAEATGLSPVQSGFESQGPHGRCDGIGIRVWLRTRILQVRILPPALVFLGV